MSDIIVSGARGRLGSSLVKALSANYDYRHFRVVPINRGKYHYWDKPIAAVVNCVGAYSTGAWSDRSLVGRMLESNAMVPIEVIMSSLPHMTNGGVIINVTSESGWFPYRADRTNSAYVGSKAYMTAVSMSLKQELAPMGIHVEEYAPAVITDYHYAALQIIGILNRNLKV